ncbi:TetR/AcrR family transcriptional regulator [Cryptosporangium phraense]|uniref:TetR/AcrR family transcriptional regulator n=1 Tax=Cryptosporangium phraense TaxID=2593070 RepID=A0A545AV43_9ACTN|nr:TetR/AcrR family transcriptional regulator [Cryptosporangium phraense]TQS45184.1 TetR/AcrR family transcriptional regulator [Cryptosporangium phraense]
MAEGVRERMIAGAMRLLAQQGPQATSFSEVLKLTKAPRGSIYHHFPGGKNQLVLAAVDAAGENALRALGDLDDADAVAITEAFLGMWRLLLERSATSMGCGVLAVTVAPPSDEVLDRARDVFRSWRALLEERLTAGGMPAGFAPTLIAAAEGAVVLARAERGLEPFDAVAGYLLAHVRAVTG